ncbi:MAG: hypothetical protein ACOY93_12150 [Bacillota bacterium]
MAQTQVRIFFHHRHDRLQEELNQWLEEVAGQVVVTGVSMDSNKFGRCLVVMYQTGEEGRLYRAHLYYHSSHSRLEAEANEKLAAAQAQWGRLVALGSNEYGHYLCIIEEQ